jgi:hypothetical protein
MSYGRNFRITHSTEKKAQKGQMIHMSPEVIIVVG